MSKDLDLLKDQQEVQILIRTSTPLRNAIAQQAKGEGVSANQYIVDLLAKAVGFKKISVTRVIGHAWVRNKPPKEIE